MDPSQLEHTARMRALLDTPHHERDEEWIRSFFHHVPNAAFVERGLMMGPDGFPYLALQDPPEEDVFRPVRFASIVERCTDEGWGLVLNPDPPPAEWVFHYGNLWSFRSFGGFLGDPKEEVPDVDSGSEEILSERRILVGAPTDEYLPPYARHAIARFLRACGIENPRVALVTDGRMRPPRSLVFDLEPTSFSSEKAFEEVLHRLTWFLPPKRQILGYAPDTIGAHNFVALE